MEILGIGASELVYIILIAIIVLGPKDMQKAGRSIGRWLNQLVQSDSWKVFQKTSRELRNLPNNLMREANMEMRKAEKELQRAVGPRPGNSTASSANRNLPPSMDGTNSIRPPTGDSGDEDNDKEQNA